MVKPKLRRDPKSPKPCTCVSLEDSKMKSVGSKTTVQEVPDIKGMGVAKSMLNVAYSYTVWLDAVIFTVAGSMAAGRVGTKEVTEASS